MRRVILSIIVMLVAALSCLAESAATNAVSNVVSVAAAKVPRQKCEAVTKSGNRCKRNAVPGEKLCRQHLKILNRKKPPKLVTH